MCPLLFEKKNGKVQEVDLSNSQEAPTSQEDDYHQAVPYNTQQEDQAVKHRLEHRIKGLQTQILLITGGMIFIRHVPGWKNLRKDAAAQCS
ncbi:hypothetical protein INR49_021323 [Caranx melampygus]|nr:hypothetical protein INR49_021323 [Caranx melampygus]